MIKQFLSFCLLLMFPAGALFGQKANLRSQKLEAVPIIIHPNSDSYFTGKRNPEIPNIKRRSQTVITGSYGTRIGHTYYDLQTNGASGNRIIRHTDGTISALWNEECNPGTFSSNYPDRGIGYNYYDGTNWIHGLNPANPGILDGTCNEPAGINGPAYGIASKRVGWPEIIALPNGKELAFAHEPYQGLTITSRPGKGTGGMAAWSPTTNLAFTADVQGVGNNAAAPRVAASGNTIHLIYVLDKFTSPGVPLEPVINGVTNPLVYSRSTDGGQTWDQQNVFLPGMTGIRNPAVPGAINPEGFGRVGSDAYAISANGNTVAIVAGHSGNAWTLWKSVDNGTTFNRTVISKITAADTIVINATADTVALTNDHSHAVVVDNAGMVHVFAGEILTKIKTHAGGTIFSAGGNWYPNAGMGLLYWNDAMPAGAKPVIIAEIEDSRPVGDGLDWIASGAGTGKVTPYGTIGLVSMPTAAVDAQNNVYVLYTAAVEGTCDNGANDGQPFRDIYFKKGFAAGGPNAGKWSRSLNVARSIPNLFPGQPNASTAENFEESVFPSAAQKIGPDNKIHFIFQADFLPGTSVGPDADQELENAIMYYSLDVNQLSTGLQNELAAFVHKISAYPNPTSGAAKIVVDLKQNAKVEVKVMNALGQLVANVAPAAMAAGKNEIAVDLGNLASGVYMYTVSSDNFTVTKRIVKQ